MEQMGRNSMSFRMLFVILFVIAFPVVFKVSLMYRNSSFGVFEGYSEGKLQRGTAQNLTELLNGWPNVTTQHDESRSKITPLASSTNGSTPPNDVNHNDNLLGGLLVSGFDKESCISRTQSHLYRKASPHKPSSYLISKLRNYEEIHRRCGPNSRAYHKSMTKIEHSKNKGAATMCKYVIWTPANGLGNQIISMAATFLYGILTDRVLLVKFGKDKQGLFCEPFLNSTWILPENSPYWSWIDQIKSETDETPGAIFINLEYTSNSRQKFFNCDNTQDLLWKAPLLILKSDQFFVPSLLMNPFFNLEIAKMFPEIDTIFHHLGRYLFHPSNDAWELISSYYEAHLAKANERIGIQIRVFNDISTPQQEVMDLVLSCTLKHKILPQVFDYLQTNSSAAAKKQTVNKAVLVASLYKEYGENLRNMYMNYPTVSGEVIKVYQPSHEGKQKFNDNRHNLKAWMEMYLLSLCDVLVTSSFSTFGYIGQGLASLKPWLLHSLSDNNTHYNSQGCQQDFSSEPCYHFPPTHYCNGEPIKNIVSTSPYFRECKDVKFGLKLVNGF